MKNWKVLLAALVGTGVIGSISFADPAPAANAGKKIFDTKCATCHGTDAKGKPAMAKMFKVEPVELDLTSAGPAGKKDEELTKTISDGKNKMPAYSKQLKADEIKAVVGYVRTLAPKKTEVKPVEKATEAAPAKTEAKPAEKTTPEPAGK